MLISIDHGNKQIKTNHRTFVSGLRESDTKPPFGKDVLFYKGKYYTLTDQRIPYMRDKTADERYFILTLFAVAFELAGTEYRKDEIVDVQLAVGLPPAHYGAQYERFENYFLNRDIIDFQLDGRPYSVFISTAICFPQAYAAIMPIYQRIHSYSKVAVLDIGGFTADYLLVKNGEADLSACDSLDNGVITLYNGIKSKVNADFDILLDESDIDAILKDTPTDFDESVIRIVQEQAQQFINDLFGKLRERMIDLRSGKAVFVGGGSILLKKQIEASGKVAHRFLSMRFPPIQRATSCCSRPLVWGDVNGEERYLQVHYSIQRRRSAASAGCGNTQSAGAPESTVSCKHSSALHSLLRNARYSSAVTS